MKIIGIIIKSFKEQLRSIWLLLLMLAMGPFFVLVYSLITESGETQFKIIVINDDLGVEMTDGEFITYGTELMDYYLWQYLYFFGKYQPRKSLIVGIDVSSV